MDRPGVRQVSEGGGEQRKMEETGCEIICGASTTLAVKELMMMMMMLMRAKLVSNRISTSCQPQRVVSERKKVHFNNAVIRLAVTFFSRLRGFLGMFNHSFPSCAFFFLKWRLARAHSSSSSSSLSSSSIP